jgi:anti-anti-sigma factor
VGLPPSFICLLRPGRYGSIWVDLAGELDLTVSPQLARTLGQAQSRSDLVVLDLRELTFMDIAGAHVIINAATRVRQIGSGLIVARGPVQVDIVFTLIGNPDEVERFDLDPEFCPPALGDGYASPPRTPRPLRRAWLNRGTPPLCETSHRDSTRPVDTQRLPR